MTPSQTQKLPKKNTLRRKKEDFVFGLCLELHSMPVRISVGASATVANREIFSMTFRNTAGTKATQSSSIGQAIIKPTQGQTE